MAGFAWQRSAARRSMPEDQRLARFFWHLAPALIARWWAPDSKWQTGFIARRLHAAIRVTLG